MQQLPTFAPKLPTFICVAVVAFCWVAQAADQNIRIHAAGFVAGQNLSANDGTNDIHFLLEDTGAVPFTQSAIKQGSEAAKIGPDPKIPYFTVRFAMPVPPENLTNNFSALTGIDPQVFTHNHSPGFEVLPNGDCLAIYFSTPPGEAENSTNTSFIQARLRYGSEDWDMPELFFKTESYNDQSGLLWNDGGQIRFFGGGRGISTMIPFREAVSADNGATWTFSIPQLDRPAQSFEAQPITCAFRDGLSKPKSIYFAMDGNGAHSFLWRSDDEGIHWHQMEGRTGGRHSVIVPLDDKGSLLSIGGKNASVNGWSPENTSTDFGASWSQSVASPFPPLGSAQRPSMIKLADGNLFFVSDAYLHKLQRPPPEGWNSGDGAFVALSTNNGATWRIKTLPVQLPNHERGTNGTLGYVTARQAANGVIHVLTTETQPCLHYELNEAWICSEAGDVPPENSGGVVKKFSEAYASGKLRTKWSARICPNGRYLLDGKETDFYESGAKQHEGTYKNGRKTGEESFWSADGKKLWIWNFDLKHHRATWTQFWPDGKKKLESNWNTQPVARDLSRSCHGMVADGPAKRWNEDGSLKISGSFSGGLLLEGASK
jgi:hypothetical protein